MSKFPFFVIRKIQVNTSKGKNKKKLSVIIIFRDMVAGAFGIKSDTKKSEVVKYFTDIATTMEKVKTKLNAEVEKNGNYKKVKEVVNEFITNVLDKIALGAKEAAKGLQEKIR